MFSAARNASASTAPSTSRKAIRSALLYHLARMPRARTSSARPFSVRILLGGTLPSTPSPIGCVDPSSAASRYGHLYSGKSKVPHLLQYQPTDSLASASTSTAVSHESTATEIRRWINSSASTNDSEASDHHDVTLALSLSLFQLKPLVLHELHDPTSPRPITTFRLLLSRAHMADRSLKIKRAHLVDILKGKFKPYHTK